jgi:hypothetical protein
MICSHSRAIHSVAFPLASPTRGEFSKRRRDQLATHVSERVAVEEEERGAPVTVPKELYGSVEGEDLLLFLLPLSAARCLNL